MHKSIFTNFISVSLSLSIAAIGIGCVNVHAFSSEGFSPRLTEPENDPEEKEYTYYYSDNNAFQKANYGMPNCTAYAWGRATELLGKEPKLSTGNAGRWYSYNITHGTYAYGSEPKLGAIACWDLNDNVNGHVAVVEKVSADRNIITTSESQWEQLNFAVYTFKGDSSDHMSRYRFLGYIYIDDVSGKHYGDAFKLKSSNQNKLLTFSENLALDVAVPLKNTALQNFRFEPVGDDSYKIWSISNDQLLYQSDESVILADDNNSFETKWKICNDSNGTFTICAANNTSKVLTVDADGIELTEYNASSSQIWKFERITGITPLMSYNREQNQIEKIPAESPKPIKPIDVTYGPVDLAPIPNNEKFTIDYSNAKTEYSIDDILDLTDIVFKLNDTPLKSIDITQLSPVYDFSTSGTNIVTINYGELSVSYPVTVIDASASFNNVSSKSDSLITENDDIVLISSIADYLISETADTEDISKYDTNKDMVINIIDITTLINCR